MNYELVNQIYGSDGLVVLSWEQKSRLIENYYNSKSLISESQRTQAKLIIEGLWDKFTNAVKWTGGKVADFSKWVAKSGMKLAKGTVNVLKKIGNSVADIFVYMIKKLPKGDVILEFIENTLGSLKERIKELAGYMKDKIADWKNTAKKTIIDFFINTLMLDDKFKEDLYDVMGITEEDVEEVQQELYNRGIRTLNELHLVWEGERLLSEAAGEKYIFEGETTDTLKVLGVLENPPDGEEGNVDPGEWMRGKAGKVIEYLFKKFGELAKKSF